MSISGASESSETRPAPAASKALAGPDGSKGFSPGVAVIKVAATEKGAASDAGLFLGRRPVRRRCSASSFLAFSASSMAACRVPNRPLAISTASRAHSSTSVA
eukprot:6205718-Pleurochrysis_carterae.AAC.12